MKTALITGIDGFTGKHLEKELLSHGYEVFGFSRNASGHNRFSCDVRDNDKVSEIVSKIKPTHIYHLAGFSNLPESFKHPQECMDINVKGTKSLLNAADKLNKDSNINPRILIVSSVLVYGNPLYVPIDELCPIPTPESPYADSRIRQEILSLDSGLDVIIARQFNHTGEGQAENFFVPSLKKQIRDAKDGDSIYVGNIDIVKDFSDVRDVVKSYRLLLEYAPSREIYNIGSGIEYNLRDMINKMIKSSGKDLKIVVDEKRYRANETPKIVCDTTKLHSIIRFKFRELDYSV
ncbi:MAG TPA: GDP-mannose 4,6-dehydratase [Alphaproteobacteria bacterium]|nr:GDP-mannose 4,6-dehydratase [Alphaproteobacteria bacterium]